MGEGGRAEAKRRRGWMRGAGRSAARLAGAPLIRLRSSKGMKKTKFLYPPPFNPSHNLRHRLHGNLVRTGYQGGRRCRAGRVAETRLEIFIRGPGPLRGSPAPAEATAGAPTIGQDHRRGAGKAPYIYFTRCRPSAPLPDCLNSQTEKSGRGNGETCIHYPVTGSLTALRENAERSQGRGQARRSNRAQKR